MLDSHYTHSTQNRKAIFLFFLAVKITRLLTVKNTKSITVKNTTVFGSVFSDYSKNYYRIDSKMTGLAIFTVKITRNQAA